MFATFQNSWKVSTLRYSGNPTEKSYKLDTARRTWTSSCGKVKKRKELERNTAIFDLAKLTAKLEGPTEMNKFVTHSKSIFDKVSTKKI